MIAQLFAPPIHLLRLSSDAWKKVFISLQGNTCFLPPPEVGATFGYHAPMDAVLIVTGVDGSRTAYHSCCRWIANGHASLLHGGCLHTGVSCELRLETTAGEPVALEGAVQLVRHVSGRVHDVLVKLDAVIDAESFRRAKAGSA